MLLICLFIATLGGKLSVCMYSWSIKNYERKNGFAFCFCAKKKKMNVISSPITTDVHPPPHTHTYMVYPFNMFLPMSPVSDRS